MKTNRRSFLKLAASSAGIVAGTKAVGGPATNCGITRSNHYTLELLTDQHHIFTFIKPSQYESGITDGEHSLAVILFAELAPKYFYINIQFLQKTILHHLYIRPFSTSIALDESPVLFFFDDMFHDNEPILIPENSYLRSFSDHQRLYLSHGR